MFGASTHAHWLHVLAGSYDWLVNKLFSDPVPFEEKVTAVAYINSNCAAPSNRNGIVQVGRQHTHLTLLLCLCAAAAATGHAEALCHAAEEHD